MTAFRPRAYLKEGCPFSFKFLLFTSEAGLLDAIEILRLKPNDPSFERTKDMLAEHLGRPATFPTVEIRPGEYVTDSDRLIEHFAKHMGVDPFSPTMSFYTETILPQVEKLHELQQQQ